MDFQVIDEVAVDAEVARVYEHGWQSWSPTTAYPLGRASHRPVDAVRHVMGCRPGVAAPVAGFQGEGVLGLDPGDGRPVRAWAAEEPTRVPSIRARLVDSTLVVTADGPVRTVSAPSMDEALAAWATDFEVVAGGGPPRAAPTAWCSWYQYFTDVSEADVLENLDAIDEFDLPVDVVQVDDGWQADVGDWLGLSGRFSSLPDLVRRIHDHGRRPGIWLAPFLATARAGVVRDHPDWFPHWAGVNWDSELRGMDPSGPGPRGYLREVFERLRGLGFDYFKIDFLYAGALAGDLSVYRSGLELIRDAIGPDAYLLGCGAPILPSVGLVDAMRVSADIALWYASPDADPGQPSQFGAELSTIGRAWQHGRWWVNDPDCIVARPEMEQRERWATTVGRYGGLRASSDRIAALDEWGLETTRRLLSTVPPPTPFAPRP
jgi:alpha-galactosidase